MLAVFVHTDIVELYGCLLYHFWPLVGLYRLNIIALSLYHLKSDFPYQMPFIVTSGSLFVAFSFSLLLSLKYLSV